MCVKNYQNLNCKNVVFVGPDIYKIVSNFKAKMTSKEKEAWILFIEVVR